MPYYFLSEYLSPVKSQPIKYSKTPKLTRNYYFANLRSQIAVKFKQKIEMTIIKLIIGVIFIFLGWIYLYNPKLVSRLNKIARDKLFNDRRVLLERKKLAIIV